MTTEQIVERILLLIEDLTQNKPVVDRSNATDVTLKELGLTSLLLYKFITALEDEFKIQLDELDLEKSRFKTIGTTLELLSTYLVKA